MKTMSQVLNAWDCPETLDEARELLRQNVGDYLALRQRLDDANGKLHLLQSMMREAGFPMRVKLGEDLHGNEDFMSVRPECQLGDVLKALKEARQLYEANHG